MKVDGVFSGGGVKAFAFLGALEVVENKGIEFERVAGASAGAIISALIATGYRAEEIKEMLLELELESFLYEPKFERVLPFLKWLLVYHRLGLYKGDKIEEWVREKLAVKGIYAFKDLPEGYLKIIGSDLSLGKIVVFPDDLQRFYNIDGEGFSIAKAVRISATIPFFFIPIKLTGLSSQKCILVDGGLLSNFPLWVYTADDKKNKRPILGMKLSSTYNQIPESIIDGPIDMFKALFSTMMKAHDARYISKADSADIMFIPTEDIDATDFDLDEEKKQRLVNIGRKSATKFLRKWNY